MPLQRRLFHVNGHRDKNASANVATNPGEKRGATRKTLLPPESLKDRNAMLCSERLRVVAAFIDEVEDFPGDGSSEKAGAEGDDGKEGSVGSPSKTALEEASPRPPASVRKSLGVRRSTASFGLDAGSGPSALSATLTSLPPIASPGHKSALDSANYAYGHSPGRSRQTQAWRQFGHAPEEDTQSKECGDRIMAALCKQAYHGVKQVDRQVFLGDERLGGTLSLAATAQMSAVGAATSSVARLRQEGAEGETPGPDDILDSTAPLTRQISPEGDGD